ncbi:MAG: radical SAM protein [Pyrodictiaceae archaeon]
MEWLELGIKPSSYISALCQSVFRLEPFTTCSYGCLYCYARWYRGPPGKPIIKWHVARLFEKVAAKLPGDKPRPLFRLATLSEPFQHASGDHVPGVVKALLRVSLKHSVPVIVNTKGPLRDRELFSILLSLADHQLLVVQVTIAFSDEISLILEPKAPLPSERLAMIEELKEHAVPVVARVQPLIPGLEDEHTWAVTEALEHGAQGVIGEPLRETLQGLRQIYRLLGLRLDESLWEDYQLGLEEKREPLLHPRRSWRARIHSALEALTARHGKPYAPCKDMVLAGFTWFRPGRTCCLEWLGLREEPLLRPTLNEYALLGWPKEPPWKLCSRLGWPYNCGLEELEAYPKPIRKAMVMHMRRLWRLIESERLALLLSRLTLH